MPGPRLPLFVGLFAAGCVPPIVRPMRTEAGAHLTVGGYAAQGMADEQFCYEDCEREDVVSFPMPHLEGRYGHLFSPHLGLTGGAYLAGPAAAKTTGYAAVAMAYGQMTAQLPTAAVAAGADLGANVI